MATTVVPRRGMKSSDLIDWMRENNYTATRLGARLGVTERTVFRWRSSDPLPSFLWMALRFIESEEVKP